MLNFATYLMDKNKGFFIKITIILIRASPDGSENPFFIFPYYSLKL